MFKIKFLILLSSFIFLFSCNMKIENQLAYNGGKFAIKYLSGGHKAFIFKNVLKQQLIANRLFDERSTNSISLEMSEHTEYLSTSIEKIASRKLNKLTVIVKLYEERSSLSKKENETIKEECIYFENKYETEQSFQLAASGSSLSNNSAESGIFIINSENISVRIIDDLLFQPNKDCQTVE